MDDVPVSIMGLNDTRYMRGRTSRAKARRLPCVTPSNPRCLRAGYGNRLMPPHQPFHGLLGYACWCGAAVKDLMMGMLTNLVLKLANLFLGLGVADAVAFFDLVSEVFHASFMDLQIGIREFSPMLPDIGGELFPLASEHVLIHDATSSAWKIALSTCAECSDRLDHCRRESFVPALYKQVADIHLDEAARVRHAMRLGGGSVTGLWDFYYQAVPRVVSALP